MSCQQLPPIAEDPYLFTEPPAASKFYSSQAQKLKQLRPTDNKVLTSPIKKPVNRANGIVTPLNGAAQKKPIYSMTQRKETHPSTTHQATSQKTKLEHVQELKQRIRTDERHQYRIGQFPLPLEHQKQKEQPQQQQQQQQQHQQQLPQQQNFLQQILPVKQKQTLSERISLLQKSLPTAHKPQQHQKLKPQLQHQQQQSPVQSPKVTKRLLLPPSSLLASPATTTNTTTTITTIPSTTQPPPLYQQHPRNVIEKKSHQNHSITNVQQQKQQPPSKRQKIHVDSSPLKPLKISLQQRTLSNHSSGILADASSPDIDVLDTIPTNKILKCKPADDHNTCSNESVASNGKKPKSKSSAAATQVFARPKVESKALQKKSGNTGKSQQYARQKRSYSQSSHHEPLQRISSRASNITTSSISLPTMPSCNVSHHIIRSNSEWHSPDTYIFDYAGLGAVPSSDQLDLEASAQNSWFSSSERNNVMGREQCLEMKRNLLRRQAYQYSQAQSFRSTHKAKQRVIAVSKALLKSKGQAESSSTRKQCNVDSCVNDALTMTAYCYTHITLNTDQKLFSACTAKYSDNSPCRVPVFDITHGLPLCEKHAWKVDNYTRILQEQKPKKISRKKAKPSAMTRPPKRNKKKKKLPIKHTQLLSADNQQYNNDSNSRTDGVHLFSSYMQQQHRQEQQQQLLHQQQQQPQLQQLQQHQHQQHQHQIYKNSKNHSPIQMYRVISTSNEVFTVCENSSAYESSEDTGVGGLSESELIGVPDEIPLSDTRLLEEHDLTNVLNQLPADAFTDLFTVQPNDPYEPTQEEQEKLERDLEEIDKQVKSLQQMTGSTNFLGDFLDVSDEILNDVEICTDVLHSTDNSDIRGLVHT